MTLDDIDAAEARAILRRLGLNHMDGSNNDRGEFWLEESGHPHFFPYGRKPHQTFVKKAFYELVEKIIDKLT